jgi:hypothetical protein
MFRPALILATFVIALAAGCDTDTKKPFTTTNASPAVELPPGVKIPDQKGPPKTTKPGKTEPN